MRMNDVYIVPSDSDSIKKVVLPKLKISQVQTLVLSLMAKFTLTVIRLHLLELVTPMLWQY